MRDNKEFQKFLDKLYLANKKYKVALDEAEKAYYDRYGHSASENDTWGRLFAKGESKLTTKILDDSVYNMPDDMPQYD